MYMYRELQSGSTEAGHQTQGHQTQGHQTQTFLFIYPHYTVNGPIFTLSYHRFILFFNLFKNCVIVCFGFD